MTFRFLSFLVLTKEHSEILCPIYNDLSFTYFHIWHESGLTMQKIVPAIDTSPIK